MPAALLCLSLALATSATRSTATARSRFLEVRPTLSRSALEPHPAAPDADSSSRCSQTAPRSSLPPASTSSASGGASATRPRRHRRRRPTTRRSARRARSPSSARRRAPTAKSPTRCSRARSSSRRSRTTTRCGSGSAPGSRSRRAGSRPWATRRRRRPRAGPTLPERLRLPLPHRRRRPAPQNPPRYPPPPPHPLHRSPSLLPSSLPLSLERNAGPSFLCAHRELRRTTTHTRLPFSFPATRNSPSQCPKPYPFSLPRCTPFCRCARRLPPGLFTLSPSSSSVAPLFTFFPSSSLALSVFFSSSLYHSDPTPYTFPCIATFVPRLFRPEHCAHVESERTPPSRAARSVRPTGSLLLVSSARLRNTFRAQSVQLSTACLRG